MNRRDALKRMAGALSAAAVHERLCSGAAEEVKKTGLGIVIYACGIRQQAQRQQDAKADLFEPLAFLEHCRRLGAGGVQVPLGVRDAEYTGKLRQQAEQYGMYLEASVGLPQDQAALDRFEAGLRTAAQAGVRAVRAVMLPGRRYEFFESAEQFRQLHARARKSLELAAPLAEKCRVRLAVENHKDHRIAELLALLKHVSSPWVGACVDTGNNLTLLEDPLEVVEALAPWAFSVHLKDQAVREYEDGFLLADMPLGQGFLDLKQMVATLRKAKPEICFGLESITRDPLKVPCLTEKYWATLAEVPGRDLARTLRMVRKHRADALPQVSKLSLEEQLAREDANVLASLSYAREALRL